MPITPISKSVSLETSQSPNSGNHPDNFIMRKLRDIIAKTIEYVAPPIADRMRLLNDIERTTLKCHSMYKKKLNICKHEKI